MRKSFYPRLAAQNIKKNGKYYLPFIITCVFAVALFFIVDSLSHSQSLEAIKGGQQLKSLLSFCLWIAAIFFFIFIFYTYSFLTKRRKKEFGLYSVLGMEKKHICLVCFFETLYVFIISIIAGVGLGLLFSKLVYLLLLNITQFDVHLGFEFSADALVATVVLFAVIFAFIFFETVRQIGKAKVIELLYGGKKGEHEPKTKWITAIIGVLALITGYVLAIVTKSPLKAMSIFIIAAILVMIGTYCLFTAGSIALLKILRKNKKFYYKTKHFVSVSGMMYRMKQNAVGLGNICILCTAVLVTISTTVSLYAGMNDLMTTMYPYEIGVGSARANEEQSEKVEKIITDELKKENVDVSDVYKIRETVFVITGTNYTYTTDDTNYDLSYDNTWIIDVTTVSEYNRLSGKTVSLDKDEILILDLSESMDTDTILIDEKKYKVKEYVDKWDGLHTSNENLGNNVFFIFPDENSIAEAMAGRLEGQDDDSILSFSYMFNTNLEPKAQVELYEKIRTSIIDNEFSFKGNSRANEKEDFYALYGGLLFIGIFLGTVFMIAAVLIIYYKQISEGYDDRDRFNIMQQVGMSRKEVKETIGSQVITVFFLPLVTAFIHLCFAFPLMEKLLKLLNLTNSTVFVIGLISTTVAFAGIYAVVYSLTARAYYKIVKS